MSARAIVQVSLWNSPYLGNFMSSQLALAHAVYEHLGLHTHHVLADGAQRQPWLADLDAAGVSWTILPRKRAGWRACLDASVREHDAALIHSHFTSADMHAARAAHAAGVPCVWHIHTGFNGYPLRQRAKDLLKMHLVARRQVARIIAVSPWLGEFVRRRGAPPDRIEVVPNPIVIERFASLPDRIQARERFGLGTDALVVLGLGWWPEVKGVDVLIEAMRTVSERHPTCQVLLVGEQQMRAFLAELLPTHPAWLRLSGFVSDAALLFAAADVFVSASRHEGQPSAIGEALACGLPVVMSDIAGVEQWSAAPRVSTFASEDAAGLAQQLDAVLGASPQQRAAAGGENRRWIESHAGLAPWCDRLCAIYEDLTDITASPRPRGTSRGIGPSAATTSAVRSGTHAAAKRLSHNRHVLRGQLTQNE